MHAEMQKKTVRSGAILTGLILAALMSGCAALGPGHTDYSDMPGSGDQMAKGPGIFHLGREQDYKGGYRIFANEPDKKALFTTHAGNQAAPKRTTQAQSAAPDHSVPNQRQQTFREFQQYQQFKNFQQMPKNSPQYRKFREWQEWKQYQQWQNSGHQ